jgi:hypothetical protein
MQSHDCCALGTWKRLVPTEIQLPTRSVFTYYPNSVGPSADLKFHAKVCGYVWIVTG